MIRWVNIVGAQRNDMHAQHGQRPQEWSPPQCKYCGSVEHNDPAALIAKLFEFSPTWSCVSLTRSTTSSEWKLFRFDKMEVNTFQILLLHFIFTIFKMWYLMC